MKEAMKYRVRLTLVTLILFAAGTAVSQERGFGIGVMMGEPTGVNGKGWISSRSALDGGLAWSFRGDGYLHAHMDYLWHFTDVINSTQQVIPYLGIGGRLTGFRSAAVVGVRVAGGLAWLPSGSPLDVFVEVAPIVDIIPETRASANAGVGVRIFFR
jgi:hypothetical protein